MRGRPVEGTIQIEVIEPRRVGPNLEHNKQAAGGSAAKAAARSLITLAIWYALEASGFAVIVDPDPPMRRAMRARRDFGGSFSA